MRFENRQLLVPSTCSILPKLGIHAHWTYLEYSFCFVLSKSSLPALENFSRYPARSPSRRLRLSARSCPGPPADLRNNRTAGAPVRTFRAVTTERTCSCEQIYRRCAAPSGSSDRACSRCRSVWDGRYCEECRRSARKPAFACENFCEVDASKRRTELNSEMLARCYGGHQTSRRRGNAWL